MHQAILSRAGKNADVIARHPLRFLRSSSSSRPPQVIKEVEALPPPSRESLFDDVYAELPWHLREQRAELLAGPRAKGHGH